MGIDQAKGGQRGGGRGDQANDRPHHRNGHHNDGTTRDRSRWCPGRRPRRRPRQPQPRGNGGARCTSGSVHGPPGAALAGHDPARRGRRETAPKSPFRSFRRLVNGRPGSARRCRLRGPPSPGPAPVPHHVLLAQPSRRMVGTPGVRRTGPAWFGRLTARAPGYVRT